MHTFTTTRTIEIRELHCLFTEDEATRLQRALRTLCDVVGQPAPVRDLSPLFTALTEFVGIVEGAAVVVDPTPRIAAPVIAETWLCDQCDATVETKSKHEHLAAFHSTRPTPSGEVAAPAAPAVPTVPTWKCPLCNRAFVNRYTHWSAKHRGIVPPWKAPAATAAASTESAAEVADGL